MRKRKIPLAGTLQNNPISTEEIADIAADIQRELETYADPVKGNIFPVSSRRERENTARAINFWV